MRSVGRKVPVSTAGVEVFNCRACEINSLVFRAVGALTMTIPGGGVDDGVPLNAGEAVSFSKTDFPDADPHDIIRFYAVASVATYVNVYGFLRD